MTHQPLPHPPIPRPGELGPDPEPLGTERFTRLMRRSLAPAGRAPVALEERRLKIGTVSRNGRPHRRAA